MNRVIFVSLLISLSLSGCLQFANSSRLSQQSAYLEQYRPQFHFSPDSMWMNDPNGMVYYEGEYHLFYQHFPDSTVWGPMHWGHAVSKDLIEWEQFPIALYPDSLGYIFSGSAVVDWNNSSGFGTSDRPPLIAIFTHHDPVGERNGSQTFQYQSLAYSLDKGRTWTKYEGNPVVQNPGIRDFRDPKVFWYDKEEKWILILAAWDHVQIFSSPNLKAWTLESKFGLETGAHGGVWECPDLFPLELNGKEYWVMLVSLGSGGPNGGSATQYFIGEFDGHHYQIDSAFSSILGKTEAIVPPGVLYEDFEQGYGNWTLTGDAFGAAPALGGFPGQHEVEGFRGRAFVNTFINGDQATGTLRSGSFVIEQGFINFLIGGGNHKGKTCINLMIRDSVVRSSTGRGEETLDWQAWDVSDLIGEEAVMEVVDQVTGGWGHINVDQIMFSDKPAIPAQELAAWLDYGKDNYAGVTWSDIPYQDGRRILIGWMSNWEYANVVPTDPWRSAMTIPRELSLWSDNGIPMLRSQPVREVSLLSRSTKAIASELIETDLLLPMQWNGVAGWSLDIDLTKTTANAFGLKLENQAGENVMIGFDREAAQMYIDRSASGTTAFSDFFAGLHSAPWHPEDQLNIELLADWSSLEMFVDGGKTVMTELVFPDMPFTSLSIWTESGELVLDSARCDQFTSIWEAR